MPLKAYKGGFCHVMAFDFSNLFELGDELSFFCFFSLLLACRILFLIIFRFLSSLCFRFRILNSIFIYLNDPIRDISRFLSICF